MLVKINLTFFLSSAICLSAFAERQAFDRYQTIVDRQMFGPPPEGFDPTKPPSEARSAKDLKKADQELTKEQEKLKSAIHFSMINVTPAGETAVGFTDSSDAKNPKNYYLKVGETRDGWTVKEADPIASSMTVVKGEIEVSLTIGGDSGKGAGKTASASAAANGLAGRGAGGSLGSLRARRLQRQNERLAQSQAQQAKMDEMIKAVKDREAAFEKRQQEERQAREEREEQQKAEREEQRKQLLQLQNELKRAREAKEAANSENADGE